MRIRCLNLCFIIITAMACIALNALADEPQKVDQVQNDGQYGSMAEWAKFANPGEHHKYLEPLVGNWDLDVRWWMEPGAPASQSKASSEITWILGGRFIQERTSGDMNGMQFHGLGITGYDNFKKKYNFFWADEMGTAFLVGFGDIDSTGKIITQTGNYENPVTNQQMKFKTVTRIMDNDKHLYEMYDIGPDGKEVKTMEITYTRKK